MPSEANYFICDFILGLDVRGRFAPLTSLRGLWFFWPKAETLGAFRAPRVWRWPLATGHSSPGPALLGRKKVYETEVSMKSADIKIPKQN